MKNQINQKNSAIETLKVSLTLEANRLFKLILRKPLIFQVKVLFKQSSLQRSLEHEVMHVPRNVYCLWIKKIQKGFHVHLIAFDSQANAHGALLVSGLQEEQVYFIFFRCSSVTDATFLSSRSMSMVSS